MNANDNIKALDLLQERIKTAYCIRDREGGNVIDTYDTLEEAVFALASFEEEDMENNDYEPGYYEVCVKAGEYWEPIPDEELMI